MKRYSTNAMVLAGTLALSLAACGGGDSDDVAGPSSAPRFPSVNGTWNGQWSGAGIAFPATLELRQSHGQIQGTLTIGRHVNEIAGTVSEFGVVRFQGQQPGGCLNYSTEAPHLGLEESNTTLDGPVVRSEPNLGGPCGSGPLFLTQGQIDLRKAL